MQNEYRLDRFIEAQNGSYDSALTEVRNGRKRGHWMWYIFPQIAGLGFSETSRYYAIKNLDEAAAYLHHPVLGPNAGDIFGNPDDMKLRSSMTLFAEVEGTDRVFNRVLDKFFKGLKDDKTLRLLGL